MAVEDGETVMGEGQEVDSESESDSSEEPQSGTPAVEEEVCDRALAGQGGAARLCDGPAMLCPPLPA